MSMDAASTLPQLCHHEFPVERLLGRGSFGEVWLAQDIHLGRPVALKTLLGTDRARLDALRQEARVLAGLRSDHVVQVYAWREAQGLPFLVLQYIAGGSLDQRVRTAGPLRWDRAARYLADVTEAVRVVHAQGVLHRDIKPANILWDADRDEALLTDFGIAAHLGAAPAIAGTPAFMAPEAFDGIQSPAADVYGLAAALFWLVTGAAPFPGTSLRQIAALSAQGLPDEEPRLAAVPRHLEQVIRAGLNPNAAARVPLPAFAELLRGSLNRLLVDDLATVGAGARPDAGLRLLVSRRQEDGTFAPVVTSAQAPSRFRDMCKVPPEPEQLVLRTGERIRIEATANQPGYLVAFNVGPAGTLTVLYPDADTAGAPLAPGRPLRVADVKLTAPAGLERLVAVWSPRPLRLGLEAAYELAGGPSRSYRATRDLERVAESAGLLEDCQVVALELDHRPA